jgi:hypothetical protein
VSAYDVRRLPRRRLAIEPTSRRTFVSIRQNELDLSKIVGAEGANKERLIDRDAIQKAAD